MPGGWRKHEYGRLTYIPVQQFYGNRFTKPHGEVLYLRVFVWEPGRGGRHYGDRQDHVSEVQRIVPVKFDRLGDPVERPDMWVMDRNGALPYKLVREMFLRFVHLPREWTLSVPGTMADFDNYDRAYHEVLKGVYDLEDPSYGNHFRFILLPKTVG